MQANSLSQLSPLERYTVDTQGEDFSYDQAQHRAIERLEDLFLRLIRRDKERQRKKLVNWWRRLVKSKISPEKGLYLWGGVGRGKTYLMDVFYDALPYNKKMRTHFHRFMRRVHQELKTLPKQADPLECVADRLAAEADVICFDEFFVVDITDAMLLANLLDALFRRGISFVATSNIPPEELYQNGLQRERFLPAIALLQTHTEVINVDGGVDYRLRSLEQAALYYLTMNSSAQREMDCFFERLVPDVALVRNDVPIEIEGRQLCALKEAEDVVWFDFYMLCDGPRSQNDYIELAREYHAVFISNVPNFDGRNDDQARRFIYLVDEFYDRNVKLILSAASSIAELYKQGKLSFEFQRTQSRLLEMQSTDYLARGHKP